MKKKRKLAVGCDPVVDELLSVAGLGVRFQSQPRPALGTFTITAAKQTSTVATGFLTGVIWPRGFELQD